MQEVCTPACAFPAIAAPAPRLPPNAACKSNPILASQSPAGLRLRVRACRFEAGEDLEDARDAAEAGDDQFLAGNDGGCGAQVGVDGEVRGEVAGRFVFSEGLFEQGVDAAIFPVHL